MLFPQLQNEGDPTEVRTIEFAGYDTRNKIDDGSMRQMRNMSTDEYPCLAPRKKRGTYPGTNNYTNPRVIFQRQEKLAVITDNQFYYDGVWRPQVELTSGVENRRMEAINSKIVIFPDKKWYDIETTESGDLEAECSLTTVAVHKNEVTYEAEVTLTLGENTSPLTQFAKGDAISFSGLTTMGADGYDNNVENAVIENIDYENNKIWLAEGWIHYPTEDAADWTESGTFTITRKVPDLEFILEYNNRLYGTMGNTIYASKLGDPTNWYYYSAGTADASYAVAVGSDGDFTGIAPLPNQIAFFKEHCIHKLYGYKPSNYQLITTENVLGLEKGSDKSIQLVNGTVFYKSREGVMLYTGDSPVLISPQFGNDRYYDAVAGTDTLKYYISMKKKGDDTQHFFVYDIAKGLWSEEDDTDAQCFTFIDNSLLYIDNKTQKIKEVVGIHKLEDDIDWYARFGDFDEYGLYRRAQFKENKRIYSKMQMRISMAEHSRVQVWISVDGGAWESVANVDTLERRVVELPIIPRRCDSFGILVTGRGDVRIDSLTRTVREGTAR